MKKTEKVKKVKKENKNISSSRDVNQAGAILWLILIFIYFEILVLIYWETYGKSFISADALEATDKYI